VKLLEEFPPVSTAEWEELIRKDLKGADYDKKLIWRTDEGIAVKPYYRREDLDGLEYLTDSVPGGFPYVRGGETLDNNWAALEEIDAAYLGEANRQAREALASGADEVCFIGTAATRQKLIELRAGITAPVHFRGGDQAAALVALLYDSGAPLNGTVDLDPVSDLDVVENAVRRAPRGFRPVTVSAYRFAESGGTITQELGYGLAQAAEYFAELTSRGLRVEQAAEAIALYLSSGSSYYLEIAKFRAARLLWARLVSAFGPSADETCRALILARTLDWDKTIYDPYVNVLRATSEAAAAAVGGCDAIVVTPFNATYRQPDEQSRRLARNTQTILKREAYLDKVVDPAGGSWFFESLTDAVARESWKIFQQVEAEGGYLAAHRAGHIDAAIGKSAAAKTQAVATRRKVFLGTNQYPNSSERMLDQIQHEAVSPRGAEVYEHLRLRMERSGAAKRVFLVEWGDLKMRKARAGFASNFFGCAGFEIQSQSLVKLEEVAAAVQTADLVVLCSSDEEYGGIAAALIAKLNNKPVIVAGNPKDAEQLRAAGVADFIHVRSNPVEVLTSWLDRLGVRA
jgi:methylmalonyl-CoA mutase